MVMQTMFMASGHHGYVGVTDSYRGYRGLRVGDEEVTGWLLGHNAWEGTLGQN